ncbi:MAG: peptide deformylase [Chloroflexi bacterium RBG_16_52_11]|nr:MAG: peptide deformylase [Chloroflexi bacterium RBG_16_52_11]
MPVRDIVTHPAPILRKKARKVTDFGPKLQTLVDDMVETMRSAPGVGLAAPQVGEPFQLIVVEYNEKEDDEQPKLFILANPEIIRSGSDQEVGTEGCLSIPGFVGDVERPAAVTLRGLNRRGKLMRVKANGWLARIFQHEVDHLNGVLFIDRAEKVWKVEEGPSQVIPAD